MSKPSFPLSLLSLSLLSRRMVVRGVVGHWLTLSTVCVSVCARSGFIYVWSLNPSKPGLVQLHASNKCTSFIRQIAWMGRTLVTCVSESRRKKYSRIPAENCNTFEAGVTGA